MKLFAKQLQWSIFLPTMSEGFNFSMSSTALVIALFIITIMTTILVSVTRYLILDLTTWSLAFLLWKMSIQIVNPFLLGIYHFIVDLEGFLYLFDTCPLPDTWFTILISHLVGCLFSFLMVFSSTNVITVIQFNFNLSIFSLIV